MAVHMKRTIVHGLLAALLIVQVGNAVAAVGRTSGAASVSPTGAAQYTIPIWRPPGVNGLTPDIAFAYSSMGSDGLLGIGWALSGFSVIARCNHTIAQDGAASGPVLAASDGYCLDGNKLRLTSGTYGVAGSLYRTELESFARIAAVGTAGGGPASWEVRQKNGLIYEYGATTDSRIETVGSSTPRLWAVNKISDRAGNYIEFIYAEDTANGSYRPAEVRYGGNSVAGTTATQKIVFTYETGTRPDPIYAYRYGNTSSIIGTITEFKRLSKVDVVYIPTGAATRTYNLAYEAAGGAGATRACSLFGNALAQTA